MGMTEGTAFVEERMQESNGEVTLADVLRARATHEGERVAYTYLVDGERQEQSLTYAELYAQAGRVAAALAARAGERVLLVFEPGLEFIAALFGCFAAGAIAVPVYPPDPHAAGAGIPGLRGIAMDAGASVVLATAPMRDRFAGAADVPAELLHLEWCCVDTLPAGSEVDALPRLIAREHVAFLQYTSGSTGAPKGVMVTHGDLIAHGEAVIAALRLQADAVVVNWLPLYHDMGLIGTILIPMQVGCRSIQLSPLAFLERPIRWLQAMSRYRGTLSPAPNFAYELVVRRTTAADRRDLDLGAWSAAMNGAEPIRADSCERFLAAFEGSGFRRDAFVPCYGLAEATLMVAGGPIGSGITRLVVEGAALDGRRVVIADAASPGTRTLVACGAVADGLEVAIVDPDRGVPCGPAEVGEIWVAGPQVAAGYWCRSAETTATFGARVAERGPFLRTGDLGFLRDGMLFVTGRLKDLIIVRGRNYYPQDLEHTAAGAHGTLRAGGGAAFIVLQDGEERLVIVHETASTDHAAFEEAMGAIRRAMAEVHGLSVHAVVLIAGRMLPKTSSGKVRRRACREAFDSGRLTVVAEWHGCQSGAVLGADGASARPAVADVEAWLLTTLARLRGVPRTHIGRDDAWASFGVDSAEAAELAAGLSVWLGRPVPLRVVYRHPTIATLAAAVHEVSA